MSITALLSRLDQLEITLEVEHRQLKVNAPKGTLTPDLVSQLKSNKQELIDFLQKYVKQRRDYVSIESAEKKEYYPLSPSQKRLYVIQQMDPANTSYNKPMVFPLEEGIGREVVKEIFKKLISRHESLRTSFETIDGEPVQKVHGEVEIVLDLNDWSGSHEFQDLLARFIKPFDLWRPPLLRLGLLGNGASSLFILLDMHHIISDGTSQAILKKEFIWLLTGGEDARGLPPLRLQYRDYSQWLNRSPQKEMVKHQEAYWLSVLSGDLPILALPLDFPRPEVQGFEGKATPFDLPKKEVNRLKNISEEANATLYMTLLSLLNIFLAKISGQEDIIVGTAIAARRHADLEPIIGMFVNTLVMRNYPGRYKTVKTFLKEVKEQTLKAFENQEYPFEMLVDKILDHRDISRNPIFDVMFAFHNTESVEGEISQLEIQGLNRSSYKIELKKSRFDLVFHVIERNGNLSFVLEYNTEIFKPEKIQRFVNYFKEIVSQVTLDANLQLERIAVSHGLLKTKKNTSQLLQGDFGFPEKERGKK